MNRWPIIWLLGCLALCGCQASGRVAPRTDDCPSFNPCDDPDTDARLLGKPTPGMPVVTPVAYQPLWPGCPATLHVMARLRPVSFHAVRPGENPEPASDPSDWVCDPPEAPLLRAGRRPDNELTAR